MILFSQSAFFFFFWKRVLEPANWVKITGTLTLLEIVYLSFCAISWGKNLILNLIVQVIYLVGLNWLPTCTHVTHTLLEKKRLKVLGKDGKQKKEEKG